jgi:predicted transposase YdaD
MLTFADLESQFQLEGTQHRYQVLRMWEQDPAPLLQDAALLPLAALSSTTAPTELLSRVAQEVTKIEEPATRQDISACAQILAGLRFEKDLIRQLFRERIMRESVIYQEILQEGREIGLQQGLQQGEFSLVMRQLTRRIGTVDPELQERIQGLSIAQLEELGEALLDFSTPADLTAWLQSLDTPQS